MNRKSFIKAGFTAAICLIVVLALASCSDHDTSLKKFSNAQWTLIGPYNEPQQDSCPLFYVDQLDASGGEYNISNTGLPDDIKNIVHVRAKDGTIDFTRAYPNKSWAVAYAYLEFEGNGEECFFRMGSDDGLRVWINGKLVVDDHSHRALDPNSNSFRTILNKGINRILVKVCQGEQGWEFSLTDSDREEHTAFLSESGRIRLSISSRSHFIGNDEDLAFSVYANPAPLTDIPYSYYVSDSKGNVVSSGNGSLGESITVPLLQDREEYYKLMVESGSVDEAVTKEKLGNGKVESFFFTGDPTTVLPAYSSKARKAVEKLNSEALLWPTYDTDVQSAMADIAPTLLYLADVIDKKQPSIPVTEDKQVNYAFYINDIIEALEKDPKELLHLTGFRQMAYRSDIDDSIQPYSLYLPDSYSPDKKYSLVIMLHGYSENDYDFADKLTSLMPEDFIIVSVFGRGDLYYQSAGEQDVLDVMDRIIGRYSVDENRVYLMGSSMGGLGTWRIGSLYADRFAAIAPYCGWSGYEFLENLGNMKTYIVHGNEDQTVSIKFDKNCAERLMRLGYDVSFIEIENGSHNAWSEWTALYPPETILDIFRSTERNPSPAQIKATIPQVRYGRHYWITVDELDTSGTLTLPEYTSQTPYDSFYPPLPAPGRFEANRSNDGSITITTERITALSIDIKTASMGGDGVSTSSAGVSTGSAGTTTGNSGTNTGSAGGNTGAGSLQNSNLTIDGTSIRVPANADVLHLVKQSDNTWSIDNSYGIKTLPPHDGGGIADLFTKPLIIVYGTQDLESARVLEAAARGLADWSSIYEFPIGMKTGIYKVKSDKELTKEDMSTHNIILLGTPDENIISQQISGALEPYYAQSNITVGGRSYTRNGLCVTMPNPKAPDRIVGYIDCSRFLDSADAAKRYFFEFQFRLRNSYSNELMGYPTFCPDIFVMTSHPFQDEWAGWFDRNWELN